MRHHLRPDGSTFHVVNFDTSTGAVIGKFTHQGAADSSVWARGQAWAVYGFTVTFRETRDPRFLDAARSVAKFFLDHLPPDHIPYWDFCAPAIPTEPRDVSAAAIVTSALFELSTLLPAGEEQRYYRQAAERLLGALTSPPWLAQGTRSSGILNHATGNKPGGGEIDVSLIYADYYFVEALLRYRKLTFR
jgi:unsaturated chondroitin disaccharide hydrolase